MLRNDLPCEECIGRIPMPALRHRCYKDSLLATAPVFAMQVTFRMLRTAERKVDAFITLTEFARGKMIEAGLPAEKIHVKPNFDRGRAHAARRPGGATQFVFLGKVIYYKGLDLLLEAWKRIGDPSARLLIAGDGPAKAELERRYPSTENMRWLDWQDRRAVHGLLDESDFLVLPSRALEGLPMVLVEALSAGTPSITPRHGAFPQLVSDGNDGFLFEPFNVDSLTQVLRTALSLSDTEWSRMSENCRTKFEQHYTEERNYRALMDIYKAAIARRQPA
jgi:glycosyltransferase involved in cell wall biosynthesis